MAEFRTIDYDHARNSALRDCTVSDQDGVLDASWIYDLLGQPIVLEGLITQEVFDDLLNGLHGSVARQGVFWRCLVKDPGRPLEPEIDHQIVATSARNGRRSFAMFLVPRDESDPEFITWMRSLDVPVASSPALAA